VKSYFRRANIGRYGRRPPAVFIGMTISGDIAEAILALPGRFWEPTNDAAVDGHRCASPRPWATQLSAAITRPQTFAPGGSVSDAPASRKDTPRVRGTRQPVAGDSARATPRQHRRCQQAGSTCALGLQSRT
jgi:hypothetical protein